MGSTFATDSAVAHALAPTPPVARAAVLAISACGLGAGFVLTGTHDASAAVWRDGASLVRLLRAMAVLKLLFAAGATAGIVWRLGSPARLAWLLAYAAALAAMWAGPGLIWDMAHLKLGALLLHGGLAAALVLLWRDPVVGHRLAAVVDARRRALRARS